MRRPTEHYDGLNITFHVTESCNLSCRYCVVGDTEILMADGSRKLIKDVVIGDMVMGFEEFGSQTNLFPTKVIKTYERVTDHTEGVFVIFTECNTLCITGEHPVLTGASEYKKTQNICVDDFIMTTVDNKTLEKTKLDFTRHINATIAVYNLETESHTYVANGIAVHNCYQGHREVRNLKLEDAKMFIDHILTDEDPIGAIGGESEWLLDRGLILDFIGGDALMRVDLVDEIAKYFIWRAHELNHKWKDRWRMSISTNGTLFGDPKVREFCEKYRDVLSLGVSIDGCPTIHNLNRSNSFPKLLEGWEYYKSLEMNELQTKATCNRDSIPYLAESVRYLHEEMGIIQIYMNFIFEDMQLTPEDLTELDRQLGMIVDYTLSKPDAFYLSMIEESLTRSVKMHEPKKSWCGAGAMPTLSVDGRIYPCFRFVPDTMNADAEKRSEGICVGTAKDGFTHKENFQRVRDCTREKISPPQCFTCEIESSCPWCIGGSYSEKGEFFRQTNICEVHKLQVKHARDYWKRYYELKGKTDGKSDL